MRQARTPPGQSTLVIVHGLGDRAASWERFAALMQPEIAVLALDLPGHGEAPAVHDYHYGSLVEHVLAAVQEVDRFALLGHSVGAAVAWLFAARYPARVTRLILVEPAAPHQSRFIHGPTPEPRHPFTYASPGEALLAMRSFDPSVTEQEIRRDYRQRTDGRWEPSFDPAIFPPLVEDAKALGEQFHRELAAITAPTLIVRGERSMLRPEQAEEILAELPSGRLVTVAGGTHFLHRQQPEELAGLVREFLGAG
jgi:pimeloyl-ACP methyl ester carboxylesterase